MYTTSCSPLSSEIIVSTPLMTETEKTITSLTRSFSACPTLENAKAKETLAKQLNIVDLNGKQRGKVEVKTFLKYLLSCLEEIQIQPKHIEVVGGAIPYFMNLEEVESYAKFLEISNPDYSEFKRLKDLDFCVDLSGYPNIRLWEMKGCVIKALQKSGLPGTYSELFSSIIFRNFIDTSSPKESFAILSFGDRNDFWIDLTFFTQLQRRELFVRDRPRARLTNLDGDVQLTYVNEHPDAWQPVRNRLKKELEIDQEETINHLGLPLLALYLCQGYELRNLDKLPTLAERFISYHVQTSKNYFDTFEAVKQNHIRDNPIVYEKMLSLSLRILLFWENPKINDWIQKIEVCQTSPEGRFINFVKHGGMQLKCLRPLDLVCIADIMGVKPRLPIPEEAWKSFFINPIDLNSEQREALFGSKHTFPVIIANKITKLEWGPPLFSTEEIFDFLEMHHLKEDRKNFMNIKFAWEIEHSMTRCFATFKKERENLFQNTIKKFLNKVILLPCQKFKPYLTDIFQERIDLTEWIEKLIKEELAAEAMEIALDKNLPEIYIFVLKKFEEMGNLKNITDFLEKFFVKDEALYKEILKKTSLDQKVKDYHTHQQVFLSKLEGYLSENQYEPAEKLLQINFGSFTVPTKLIERLLSARYMEAFNQKDFVLLSFLINQGVQHQIDKNKLSEIFENVLTQLLKEKAEDVHKEWAINFLSKNTMTSFISKQQEFILDFGNPNSHLIALSQIESWLKLSSDFFLASKNMDALKMIYKLLQTLQINKRKVSVNLLSKLSEIGSHLLQNKNTFQLFIFLKEMKALKLKLNLPQEALFFLNSAIASAEFGDEKFITLTQVYVLPEKTERSLLETYLLQLSISNPSQAVLLFNQKLHLWQGKPKILKSFFNLISANNELKTEVFYQLSEWEQESWLKIKETTNQNHNHFFRLTIDPRAFDLVDAQCLQDFILHRKGPLKECLQLINLYQEHCTEELKMGYLKRLKEENYPLGETQTFFNHLLEDKQDSILTKESIEEIQDLVQQLGKKTPQALIEITTHLQALLNRIPDNFKKDFLTLYLNLLPYDFEHELYTQKIRDDLKDLAEAFNIENPFTLYLGLTDSSLEKAEQAFKLSVEKKIFTRDQKALKKLVSVFSKIISNKPESWKLYKIEFIEKYLSGKEFFLSSLDILENLEQIESPELKALFIDHTLRIQKPQYDDQSLALFQNLINNNQFDLVKELISKFQLSDSLKEEPFKIAFRKAVEKFIPKIITNHEGLSDEDKIQTFKWIIKHIHFCFYKEEDFKTILNLLGIYVGESLLRSNQGETYINLIQDFIKKVSLLYSPTRTQKKRHPPSSKELPGKINLTLTLFQLKILNIFLSQNKKSLPQNDFYNHYVSALNAISHFFDKESAKTVSSPTINLNVYLDLLETVIQTAVPEAFPSVHQTMHDLIDYCFSHSLIDENQETCKKVMTLFQNAVTSNIYNRACIMLLKTTNHLSKLSSEHHSLITHRYQVLNAIIPNILDEISVENILNNLKNFEEKHTSNSQLFNLIKEFARNYIYRLQPHDFAFSQQQENFKNLINRLIDWTVQDPSRSILLFELSPLQTYMKHNRIQQEEISFCCAIESIICNLPKEHLDSCFRYLLDVYKYWIMDQNIPLTEATIQAYGKILKSKPIQSLNIMEFVSLTQFMDVFLSHLKKLPASTSNLVLNLWMVCLLKWQMPSNQTPFTLIHFDGSFNIFSKLLKSPLSSGNFLLLFGYLEETLKIFCANMQSQNFAKNGQKILFEFFLIVTQRDNTPDPHCRSIWEPTVLNICKKIILNLDQTYHPKIDQILNDPKVRFVLEEKNIQEMKAMLKKT